MTLVVGIDIGTSACKVSAFTPAGTEVASCTVGYPLLTPHNGHVEQDPVAWREAAFECLRTVTSHPDVDAGAIVAVGVAGQSWACVSLDRDGQPLGATPIWMDTRSKELCASAVERVGAEAIFEVSQNRLSPGYTTGKILWMRANQRDLYARTRWFLQSNSWIVHELTGALTFDISQTYGVHGLRAQDGTADESLCEALGIPLDRLPEVVESSQVVGRVTAQASARTGLLEGTPVVAGGLDAACAALGAGVHAVGDVQEQGGQAGGMSIVVDRPVGDPSLILGRHVIPGVWLLQGGTIAGGASLRWIVEQVGAAEYREARSSGRGIYEEVSVAAGASRAGSGGVVFLPYLAGERSPLWDPNARGVLYGLSLSTTRGDMYRAVMEGVAFSLEHNLEVARATGATIGELIAVGGASSSEVWTQIKADVTGQTFKVPATDSATTLGAAMLAGLGVGLWTDAADAIASTVSISRVHEPNAALAEIYARNYQVYRSLYDRLRPLMQHAADAAPTHVEPTS